MAQDTGSQQPNSKPQDVDLDELEVVILIIGKNATSLNQAASFLTRRGWPTTVMTNMSKAVEHIAENKPDFVLVSFNHPNPAILKLPDLITQTFNLACVGFIENMDATSQQRLTNFKMRYKIQGMPSGPNLQRTLRKILSEKFNIKGDEPAKDSSRADRGGTDQTVTVKGGKDGAGAGPGGSIVQGGDKGLTGQQGAHLVKGESGFEAGVATGSGRKRLSQLNADGAAGGPDTDADGGDVVSGETESESVSTGKYTMSKKTRKSLKDLVPAGDGSEDKPGDMLKGEPLDNKEGKSGRLADMLKKSLFGENGDNNASEEDANPSESGRKGGSVSALEAAAAQAAAAAAAAGVHGHGEAEGEGERAGLSALERAQAEAETASAEAKARLNPNHKGDPASDAYYANARNKPAGEAAGLFEFEDPAAASTTAVAGETQQLLEMTPEQVAELPPAKVLERAVTSALHRVCKRTPGAKTRPLGVLTKVAVFPVDSGSMPGYLVMGLEQDENKIEDFFLRTCEVALREEMSAMNVPAQIESGFWVHVPEVSFHIFTQGKAEFQVVLPHEEGEVGVGFFPRPGLPKPQVYAENKDMLSIAVDDISTEHPVNFKAYLHLKKNKKYYLYLRNGRVMQPEQKKRLKGRKVNNILMKTVEAENLRMFMAASYLRDIIKKPA